MKGNPSSIFDQSLLQKSILLSSKEKLQPAKAAIRRTETLAERYLLIIFFIVYAQYCAWKGIGNLAST